VAQSSSKQATLRRQSRIFRALSSIAVAITLAAVVSQVAISAAPLWKGGPVEQALLNTAREIVLSVPALLYVAALYFARRVFIRIAAGEIFVKANGEGLRALGRCLLVGGLWAILAAGLVPYLPDQPLALTMSEVARQSSDVVLAALGLALTLIGKLMTDAATLKSQIDEFV
jgi:Protein of unknown function (DUF2975)